ncbi:MAG: hypothetical protein JWR69_2523 [Pedosphaera sp.]|nr:hypothetical protein [Pedosphaera sp.]
MAVFWISGGGVPFKTTRPVTMAPKPEGLSNLPFKGASPPETIGTGGVPAVGTTPGCWFTMGTSAGGGAGKLAAAFLVAASASLGFGRTGTLGEGSGGAGSAAGSTISAAGAGSAGVEDLLRTSKTRQPAMVTKATAITQSGPLATWVDLGLSAILRCVSILLKLPACVHSVSFAHFGI